MRKHLLFLVLALMCITFAGCHDDADKEKDWVYPNCYRTVTYNYDGKWESVLGKPIDIQGMGNEFVLEFHSSDPIMYVNIRNVDNGKCTATILPEIQFIKMVGQEVEVIETAPDYTTAKRPAGTICQQKIRFSLEGATYVELCFHATSNISGCEEETPVCLSDK